MHPEELLDREQRGALNAAERELLQAHLARCAACRLERQLRVDFERELGDGVCTDITGVVSTAMQACELPEADESAQRASAPMKGRMGRRWVALLAACALLGMGVGLAGAQLGLSQRRLFGVFEDRDAKPPTRARRAPRHASAPVAAPTPSALQAAPAGEGSSSDAVPGSIASKPARMARAVVHPRRSPRLLPQARSTALSSPSTSHDSTARSTGPGSTLSLTGVSSEPARSAEAAAPAPEAPTPARASEGESSAHLFELANRARRMGRGGEANALYRELQARFPESAEARLSVAVAARMQLDYGQAREALAGFEAYLRGPDKALHEEAMVGRIKALMRLERMADAREAARDLLALHPRSAFVDSAKKLLDTTEP